MIQHGFEELITALAHVFSRTRQVKYQPFEADIVVEGAVPSQYALAVTGIDIAVCLLAL